MTRVLVTGAGGFIGRQCLPLLAERGFDIHAVSTRPAPVASPSTTWHRADLLAPGAVKELCAAVRADHLLHLAWDTTPGAYTRSPLNLDWLSASLQLVRGFVEHGGGRLVTAGTCFEYAHSDEPIREHATAIGPDTLYGTSKVALQAVLSSYAEAAGVGAAWGRVFFLYGPYEHPDRLVSSVIRSLLAGRAAPCSIGTQVRDFLHVRDVAGALVALLASDVRGPVNIASGLPVTIRDLVIEIGEEIGRPELLRLGALPMGPRDAPRIVADVARLRHEVGFSPHFSLREGVRDTVRYWAGEVERESKGASTDDHGRVGA
jgi:nucleoside-diphosphate-sugar epimerase